MNPSFRVVSWSVGAVLLAGCTVGPDYTEPASAPPPSWREDAGARVDADGVQEYWRTFGDAALLALQQRAIAGNRDLRAAAARVREARVLAAAAGSQRWPRVDVAASYSNSRLSEHGFLESLATGAPGGGGGGAVFPGQQLDLHQVSFDASWELDLFGGRRRAVEAADADAEAVAQDLRAVQLALCGDVADAYLELRSLQHRHDLSQRLVADHRAAIAVLDEQVAAGVASALDLARAETQLAAQEAQAAAVDGDLAVQRRRLETLLGEAPGALDDDLASAPPPAVPDVLAVDVPAATLRRRPDVAAAERRLAAATARIGVATAELYPRLSLTGAFGLQAQRLDDLPLGDSRFWAIGPQLRWPLFDFGRVRAGVAVADERAQQALAAYEGAVLAALGDVEIALVRVVRWRRQLAALERASGSAQLAVELADEQYRSGVLEYLALLDAQRTRDCAADDAAQGRAALAHAVVALGKALGGGLGSESVENAQEK